MNVDFPRKKLIVIGSTILLVMALAAGSQSSAPNSAARKNHLNWRPWSDAVFVEAKRGHRFVLLDLEAV